MSCTVLWTFLLSACVHVCCSTLLKCTNVMFWYIFSDHGVVQWGSKNNLIELYTLFKYYIQQNRKNYFLHKKQMSDKQLFYISDLEQLTIRVIIF